jgi:hypothetical protein
MLAYLGKPFVELQQSTAQRHLGEKSFIGTAERLV